eukprot:2450272-Prymnesium_polylepis.1
MAAPPDAAEGASESAPSATGGTCVRARVKPERAAHGRARWAQQIEGGVFCMRMTSKPWDRR